MTLALTPQILVAAYEFLRATPPFRGWKLPHADQVEFHVVRRPGLFGEYATEAGKHRIAVSCAMVGTTDTLLRTMAHEMTHLYQARCGRDPAHGRDFARHARCIARHHGFDPKAF